MTESASNTHTQDVVFTKEEIARAIHQIAYRKAYNNSPRQKQVRKERQERVKSAMRWVREHPEVVL